MSDGAVLGAAVVGLGAMGRVHLAAYECSPHAIVRHVCDVDPAATAAVGSAVRASHDVAAVAADDEVDVVSVCLPHHLHVPVASQLLDAGKAVILEKPIAVDLDDAERLVDVASRHPGRLVVKSYLRHAAAFGALRRLVVEGAVGTPRLAVGTFASLRRDAGVPAWRLSRAESGGGALLDAGIHLVDVLQWCFGAASVVAAVDRADERDLDLDAAVLLAFAEGPLATVNVTQSSACTGPYFRLEVLASRGRVVVEPDGAGALTCRTEVEGSPSVLVATTDWWARANEAAIGSYVASYVEEGRLGEPPDEALRTLRTVLAAYAAGTRQEVVA